MDRDNFNSHKDLKSSIQEIISEFAESLPKKLDVAYKAFKK
jgi:hypothetical protein